MEPSINQVLTESERNALHDAFSGSADSCDARDLILSDIPPQILRKMLQADSITMVTRSAQEEINITLHLDRDGYHITATSSFLS
jgi:hypothetical protein